MAVTAIKKFFSGIQGKLVGLYLALTIVSLATISILFYRTAGGALPLVAGLTTALLLVCALLLARLSVRPPRALPGASRVAGSRELEQANLRLEQANQELEQQRALVNRSERLATMGEMAAGIAHEINNPLTTMKNLVHTLRVGLSEDDTRTKDMAIIEEEIDKINKLVLNFLRYARPVRARVAPVSLNQLVHKTMVLLDPQLKQRQISAVLDLEPELPRVAADAEQLGQVCLNLLLNAIQASPEGEQIRVFSRSVPGEEGGATGGGRVQLGVADQGPGIAAEDQERVFEPFFTTKAKGSGLGLAISHRIVEEHGGELTFASSPGGGVTFLMTLDVDREGGPWA